MADFLFFEVSPLELEGGAISTDVLTSKMHKTQYYWELSDNLDRVWVAGHIFKDAGDLQNMNNDVLILHDIGFRGEFGVFPAEYDTKRPVIYELGYGGVKIYSADIIKTKPEPLVRVDEERLNKAFGDLAQAVKDIVNAAGHDPYSPKETIDTLLPYLNELYCAGLRLEGEL